MRLPLATVLLFAALAGASGPAAAASSGDGFDLGRGPQGELCRAERLWNGPGARDLFDRAFNLRCRGWTDTLSVGRLYAVGNVSGALAAIEADRKARMVCGDPIAVNVSGIGTGQARKCRFIEGGFSALAVTVTRGKSLLVGEGLDRFNANIAAGLKMLAGGPAPGGQPTAKIDVSGGKEAGFVEEISAAIDESALAGRRREAIDYSVRGENVEAREIIDRSQAQLGTTAPAVQQAAFQIESALSESNLGNHDIARRYLDRAATLLDGPTAGTSPAAAMLRAKLPVYRALVALNSRDYPAALTAADAGLLAAQSLQDTGGAQLADSFPLANRAVIRELNARSAASSTRSAGLQAELLRAQALYVRGAALRQTGKPDAAAASLAAGRAALDGIERAGVDGGNLQWLFSQIDAEQARLAIASGRAPAAGPLLADAVARLERTPGYAGSPILAQRKLAYANYLAERGDKTAALPMFDSAVTVMTAAGPSAATGGAALEAYFDLLEEQARGNGPAASEAKAKFFTASQMINPPAVAAQIAQLQKIFESGNSKGAVLAKTLQDLDREARSLGVQISALSDQASRERQRLQVALDENARRTAEVRSQLSGDQSYLQANDSAVTLAELQKALRPGEAYTKLLTLPRHSYMFVATHDGSGVYRVGTSTAELNALATKVRKSIDGYRSASGKVVPLVFDVAAARSLDDQLLGPAAPLLAGVNSLVVEPTGAMTALPMGVLVTDQASVDWFAANVKKNSRDYSQIKFLATRYDLGTSVSPRAFLVARASPPSHAANPYIGFGAFAPPTAAVLADLGKRQLYADRCAAGIDQVRGAFAATPPVGAKELAAASQIAGPGSVVISGEAFNDQAVYTTGSSGEKNPYRDFAVVHFATHGLKEGELGCDNPPALMTSIAPSIDSDGLLTFAKIAGMQFDANLAVLSACNTASETTVSRAAGFRTTGASEGTLSGLVRAFLAAGTRTVLTTHWAIPDTVKTPDGRELAPATELVETLFRDGLTDNIAAALRKAQTNMIGVVETSHPYYWGAFAIVGDGEKLMFARAPATEKKADAGR